jgi:hypothetical protein
MDRVVTRSSPMAGDSRLGMVMVVVVLTAAASSSSSSPAAI